MMRDALRTPRGIAVALFVVTLACFAPGFTGPFLLDDFSGVLPMRAPPPGLWIERLLAADVEPSRWRVLSNLSFQLQDLFFGSNPPSAFPYKVANVLVHAACGFAVAALAQRLARGWRSDLDASRVAWIGWSAAGLFVLHPLQVHTVLYIVQRMAELSALFALLGCIAWMRLRERIDTVTHLQWLASCAGIVALGLLSAASKENGVLLPLGLLAIEVSLPPRPTMRRTTALLVALPLVLGSAAGVGGMEFIAGGYDSRDFTMSQRLTTQVVVLAQSVVDVAWPLPTRLGFHHDDVGIVAAIDARFLLAIVLLVGLLCFAVAVRRRWPEWTFAIAWFFGWHLLESTVLALELRFDHRNYLPLAGPAIALAYALVARRRYAIAAVLVALFAAGTLRHAYTWGDHARLVAHERSVSPRSIRSLRDAMMIHGMAGDWPGALAAYGEMQAAAPDSGTVALYGLAFECAGRADETLRADIDRRLARGVIEGEADRVLAALLAEKRTGGCHGVDGSRFVALSAAALANPSVARRPTVAANWRLLRAKSRLLAGDPASALAEFKALVADRPDVPIYLFEFTRAAIEAGDREGADSALAALDAWASRVFLPPRSKIDAFRASHARRFGP